ncbi:MAG: YciI family protein [Kiloniellales bacterium]
MIYVVSFEDNEDRADMRARHMAAHLAFLEHNAASVRAAGPLKDTADAAPAGGLWLVEAASPEAVHALVKADPFWPTGLRKSYRVLEWTQVFAEGKRRN